MWASSCTPLPKSGCPLNVLWRVMGIIAVIARNLSPGWVCGKRFGSPGVCLPKGWLSCMPTPAWRWSVRCGRSLSEKLGGTNFRFPGLYFRTRRHVRPNAPATTGRGRFMRTTKKTILVAIAGGSGAGKTRLAADLQNALGNRATRLSLDDFYRDRSQLSPGRRTRINFDHPRAIDWAVLEKVLRNYRAGRPASVPCYDFNTHCRRPVAEPLSRKPVVILEGLWTLRRRTLRPLFELRIFIECPLRLRRERRLARDMTSRGRSRASVQRQFRKTVQPMHGKFVAPQRRWAHVILPGTFTPGHVDRLAASIESLLGNSPDM